MPLIRGGPSVWPMGLSRVSVVSYHCGFAREDCDPEESASNNTKSFARDEYKFFICNFSEFFEEDSSNLFLFKRLAGYG